MVSDITVSPNPAKVGPATITFEVLETLQSNPVVSINNEEPAAFSRRFSTPSGWGYEYTYNISAADQQGEAAIEIEVIDLANNQTTHRPTGLFVIDTIKPAISSVEVSPTRAKAGPVTITFNISETLEADPMVKVNSNLCTLTSKEPVDIGQWTYTYAYEVTSAAQQGLAEITITATDLASNLITQKSTDLLTIDTASPVVSNIDLNVEGNPRGSSSTAYAKLGSEIKIDFSVSEELLKDPRVMVTSNLLPVTSREVAGDRIDYSYLSTVTSFDADGVKPVTIEIIDLAGNVTITPSPLTLMVDQTSPEVGTIIVSKDPANAGSVYVDFSISDTNGLKVTPTVEVTLNGVMAKCPVSQPGSNSYRGVYTVLSGTNGRAAISVKATDKALNSNSKEANFEVDTIAPTFSHVSSTVIGNEENPLYAKEGATVLITFEASEALKFEPEVRVNSGKCTKDSETTSDLGHRTYQYTYEYTVTSADVNGQATVLISGYDLAGNYGEDETSLPSETFVIDLQNPTVVIAMPEAAGDLISNPAAFSTNANPDGSDQPRATAFYYKLAEPSKVRVKVHKVNDSQTSYVKSDFNSGNLIKTLVDNVWQAVGVGQTISWEGTITDNVGFYDANGDGFADPGKYAFIVEGSDRAGNLTLKKWGGTVWVQNNVLFLRGPEQLDFAKAGVVTPEANPDPHYISPNGNSTQLAQKRARFYFMTDLSLNPESNVPKPAERIEASMAVHTKAVGKYSVKVYGNVGLSNLVRTIVQDATVEAASLTYEDWNGKNDAGQFVPNGTYYIVAAEKDYANNPSTPSLWQRSVTVDNSSPEVSSVSAAPYYFSATGATILTYTVADNQASAEVTVAVYKGTTFIKTLLDRVWKNNGTYAVPWAGDRAIADGVYTFKVSAVDLAGNISLTKEAAVYRDTTGPDAPLLSSETHNGSDYAPVSPSWSTHKSPYLSWAAVSDNGGSGVAKYEVAVDGGSWSSLGTTLSWHGTLADGSGRQVAVRGVDNLGNLGVQGMLTFEVDTTPPYFTLGPEIKSGERGTWSQTKEIKIEFAAADLTSDFASFSVLLDKSEQRNQGSPWTKTINDGVHTVEVRVYDQAGLYTDSTAYTFKADTTPPNQPVLTIGETPVGSWSNHNTPLITWSNPGDGGGSGVVSYHGFIDSIDQGVVASGWHPTLTDGTHTLFVRAIDGVGLTTNSASHTFKIDTVVPTISQPQPTNEAFNPYVDNSIRVDFTASDPAPSSGFLVANITARIKKSVVVTKDLNVIDDGSGNYHIIWDGIDNALDYVNEGAYILEVTASDGANNQAASKTTTIHLTDDQYIASGHDPRIAIDGKLYLSWVNGTSLVDSMVEARVEGDIDPGNSAYTDVEGNHLADKEFFTISNLQTVEAHAASTEEHLEIRHSINRRLDSSEVWAVRDTWGDDSGSHNYDEYLTPGTYYAYVDQIAGNGFTRVYYQARQDNLYVRSCSQDYVKKITDHLNYSQSGPTPVPSHLTGPTSVSYGGSTYQVLAHDGCIFFQKDTSTEIKIAGSSEGVDGGYGSPAICVDESGFYVAWSHGGSFDLGGHIYFQKIPHNFAPLSDNPGSRLMSYAVQTSVSSSSATATLEAPVLVSPTNNEPAVRSLRPTFTWKHQRSNQLPVTSYQLELAKNDTFSLDHQQFSKSPDSGSLAKEDATLFNYTYQIHEFDPGLDRDTYFWKVTALATNEAATSESWSFTVAPPLTLTGVTNYPNPFNPKHQSTKIRYRLGGDADEVTIRIYDVTGALVIEIPNCPTDGEGSSLLAKYHDVAWNGRNGRGDLVVNGIYPFEVTARVGDNSISARGKVAVLK